MTANDGISLQIWNINKHGVGCWVALSSAAFFLLANEIMAKIGHLSTLTCEVRENHDNVILKSHMNSAADWAIRHEFE